jgi:hypothetical protein
LIISEILFDILLCHIKLTYGKYFVQYRSIKISVANKTSLLILLIYFMIIFCFVLGVSRAQEAWISSASSCQLSGGEEAFTSLPTTPGPTSNFASIPVTPASYYDEEPTHDIPLLKLDSPSVSNSQHGVNNSYAKIKAAFIQPYSNHAQSYECDPNTNVSQDEDASKLHYYSDSSPVYSQPQRLNSSQSESSHDRQPVMKPPLTLLEQKKLKWAKERGLF